MSGSELSDELEMAVTLAGFLRCDSLTLEQVGAIKGRVDEILAHAGQDALRILRAEVKTVTER